MSIAEEDMSEKDPAIKLFGRKIPLPECQIPATSPAASQIPANSQTMDVVEGVCEEKCEQHNEQENEEKGNSINPMEDHETEETSSTDQDKVMKKPDKIVPCPRCNSLETKFCYFNNYNVNQPRHFCKNCQRYWTAGGTMRNVPVGAGRRKNKHHLASQFRQIIVSSSSSSSDGIIPTTIAESSAASWSSSSSMAMDNNGIVLKFGPDAPPLCESMETMLNLRDKKTNVEAENGKEPSLCGQKEPCVVSNELNTNNNNQCGVTQMVRGLCSFNQVGMERHPLGGSPLAMDPTVPEGLVIRSAPVDTRSKTKSTNNNTSNHLQCYPVPPWMFPWNNPQSSAPMPWYPTPMVVVPGMCPPNISLQYRGGTPVWAAGTGMVSIGSNCCLSPSSPSTSNNCCSSNGSPTLGKHPRDTVFTEEDKSEKCVLVPKTLRIDDPNEASKSPIWAALGIKPDKKDCEEAERGGAGAGDKGKDRVLGVSQILEANPAAISRAHSFQESI